MTTEALMKRCQIGVPRGPNAYDQLHSILAECYGTLGAQATEIDRLRAEVAGLREDAERLDFLLHKLPGDALRYVLGELSDTSNGAEFRAAIDAARKGEA